MITISGKLCIKCSCGHENILGVDVLEHECHASEREMGIETEHDLSCAVICEKCRKALDLRISVFEYPEGDITSTESACEGGTLETLPEITAAAE